MRATAATGRVPDFFIVGHHKSGTTALYEMLRRHPQIFMPELKEPRWFDSDLRALVDIPPTSALPRSYEDYLALFLPARPDQVVGEASPSYLRSAVAARAIAEVAPGARCIAIFREPASFVRSLQLQLLQEHVEHEEDLGRAVANECIVRAGRTVRRYSDHVHYAEQLRRFHEVFPAEQLLVLIYEEFRGQNEATVRRVLDFLGVDSEVEIEPLQANPTVAVRSQKADRMIQRLYGSRTPLVRTVRRLIPSRARRTALGGIRRGLLYGAPATPDATVMAELRERYRPEARALSEYLGRDLEALWGSQGV